jgi:hypothetical protein
VIIKRKKKQRSKREETPTIGWEQPPREEIKRKSRALGWPQVYVIGSG